MEWAVVRLERFQADARSALDVALEERREAFMNPVNISPTGPTKRAPHYIYKSTLKSKGYCNCS